MQTVIVIGGGFGGLETVRSLGHFENIRIILVDCRNYHLFQPLLYQIAMAGLSSAEIAMPLRSIFADQKNVEVILGRVSSVDRVTRRVEGDFGILTYDYLIVAAGASHSYFGHDDWEDFAPGLKTLEQAIEIRRRVFLAFELAEREADAKERARLLTFAIIGAGPTGVELAGALCEISRFTVRRDFRRINPSEAKILLIEAAPRILPSFTGRLSDRAARDLRELGVTLLTSTKVDRVDSTGVYLAKDFIPAGTILWAAGVKPSILTRHLQTPLEPSGRVIVTRDLSLPADPNVFVIGDMAAVEDDNGRRLPGLAPVAIQEGQFVARQIMNDAQSRSRETFAYHDRGQMATIGRSRAVIQWKWIELGGFFAWAIWLIIHIYFLIGFRNRLVVILDWTWAYFTYRRGARLIVERDWKSSSEYQLQERIPEREILKMQLNDLDGWPVQLE